MKDVDQLCFEINDVELGMQSLIDILEATSPQRDKLETTGEALGALIRALKEKLSRAKDRIVSEPTEQGGVNP